jgi:hypothetical protein
VDLLREKAEFFIPNSRERSTLLEKDTLDRL